MNPYSLDLRERIVASVLAGTPRVQVIHIFQISAATLKRYLKQHRTTGQLSPRPHTGGQKPQIGSEQFASLQHLVAAVPDATLAELCAQWQEREGIRVSRATMSRALAHIGWTRKKRR